MLVMVWRPLPAAAALSLALAACFNPTGQTDETGASEPATSGPTTTSSPTTSSPTTTSEPTTTEPTPTTTTGDCDADADCAAPDAYCLASGLCGDCNAVLAAGDSCSAHDPDRPTCDVNSGACVECFTGADCTTGLCDEATHTCITCTSDAACTTAAAPVCDPATHECRRCDFHDECPDTACDIITGACFVAEDTDHFYATPGADACGDILCIESDTCCSPNQALQAALGSSKPNHVIHLAAGTYDDPLLIVPSGGRIAILGPKAGATFTTAATAPTATIDFGNLDESTNIPAALYLSRLKISSKTTAAGVRCQYSAEGLWLDDSEVTDHSGGPAVYSRGCKLTVRRTLLKDNQSAAYADSLGAVHLQNTTVLGSKGDPTLYAESAATVDVLYSTLLDTRPGPDQLLFCGAGGSFNIRNSAVLTTPGPLGTACIADLTAGYSAFTDPTLGASPTNRAVTMPLESTLPAWTAGDLDVVVGGGEFAGVALWEPGLPTTDRNGDLRPGQPGPDVAGADLPNE